MQRFMLELTSPASEVSEMTARSLIHGRLRSAEPRPSSGGEQRHDRRDQMTAGRYRFAPHLGPAIRERFADGRTVALRARSKRAFAVSAGLLLFACHRVNVTPLGSTREGRPQFEITCNRSATESGSCNEKALAVCVRGYETTNVSYSVTTPVAYNGQLASPPADRVLLITCN